MCMLSRIIQEIVLCTQTVYMYIIADLTNNTNLHIPFFKMMYLALKEVGGAETQMWQWQHTLYLSVNFI